MGAKQYPAYKDSGVEWIGEIPEHWEVKRLKDVAECRLSNVDKHTVDGEPSVYLCNYVDVYKNDFITSDIRFMAATATVRQISRLGIQTDDVLITKDSESPDDIGVPALVRTIVPSLVCGYHLALIRPDGQVQDGAFTFRYLASKSATSQFQVLAKGITRYAIGKGEISRLFIPSPPLEEQKLIASFLDRETGKIDTLVEHQQQLIRLLKEKRQSLISHTVTKGLNPNVRMKDSDVEWIGEIPEHWEVKPLRYLGRCQNGLNIGGDAFGSGFPFVSYGDVYKNTVLPSAVKGLVESSETDWISYSVQRGDVLFTRTSETIDDIGMASTCLETIPKATFAGFLIRFRPIRSLDCGFSKHYFSNRRIRAFFAREMVLITRASLSQDLLKQLPVLLPPESEQIEIIDFLDTETSKIDELVIKANQSIALLKERRNSLISAAVTGKIDLREAA